MKKLLFLLMLLFPSLVKAQVVIPEDTTTDAEKLVYVYLVDITDGYTPETGITITLGSGTECQISKNGGAFAACANGVDGAWTELANGVYTLKLDDTDVTTAGQAVVKINDGGGAHRVFLKELQIIPVSDGTAQAGAASTITLASAAVATDDTYNGQTLEIVRGTGIGQRRRITDYVGSTRVATIDTAWVTTPSTDSQYKLVDYGNVNVNNIENNMVTANVIAADAIGASEIASAAIQADEIASDAIGAAEIATDAIGALEIAAAAITNTELTATPTIGGVSAAALADMFDTDSGTTYAASVSGSVVQEIADNAAGVGGGGVLSMAKSFTNRVQVYSATGITAAATGAYVPVPIGISDYYIKVTATEQVNGGITLTLYTNEAKSTTNPRTVHTTGALSETGVTRTNAASVSGDEELGPYIYLDLTSVTGTWDITVELWYQTAEVV